MTSFEDALAEYKTALAAAEADVSSDVQREMFQLHVATFGDIEQRYAETAKAYDCRILIESEGLVHQSEILKGPGSAKMREAFSKLVQAVREAYDT